ncbi:hypothetical protein FGB62_376g04 [Gracilaria domingensis]|nr:hypothetical protein FGB62_376g04 [Gracilaria domingensis]
MMRFGASIGRGDGVRGAETKHAIAFVCMAEHDKQERILQTAVLDGGEQVDDVLALAVAMALAGGPGLCKPIAHARGAGRVVVALGAGRVVEQLRGGGVRQAAHGGRRGGAAPQRRLLDVEGRHAHEAIARVAMLAAGGEAMHGRGGDAIHGGRRRATAVRRR